MLEVRVSNVTNFGAFVDIGVHRDGLVHVSELTHRWVTDPREAVQVGEIVKVKVLEVDYQRERISLSIKVLQQPPAQQPRQSAGNPARKMAPPSKPGPSVDDLMRKSAEPPGEEPEQHLLGTLSHALSPPFISQPVPPAHLRQSHGRIPSSNI